MGQQLDQGDGEGRTGYVCDISQSPAGKKERNLLLDDLLKESFYLTERNANYRQALDGQLALRRKELSPMLEISDTAFIKKKC